jgi:predicted HTH transcriptional regulator
MENIPTIELVKSGETDTIEFKSSLIWDYKKKQPNKLMGIIIARAISSFMNSEGGIILIGVDNDKNILGIDKDLSQLDGSYDNFELHLTNVVNNCLGKVNRPLISPRFDEIVGKKIAVIFVKKSPRPVYLKHEGKIEFFIRSGNSCQPLDVSEATDYIKDHWPDLR